MSMSMVDIAECVRLEHVRIAGDWDDLLTQPLVSVVQNCMYSAQRDRDRDRQTDRQTQTHRHTDTQTHRHTDTHTETPRHRETDRRTDGQTDRQTGRQTGRQTRMVQRSAQVMRHLRRMKCTYVISTIIDNYCFLHTVCMLCCCWIYIILFGGEGTPFSSSTTVRTLLPSRE